MLGVQATADSDWRGSSVCLVTTIVAGQRPSTGRSAPRAREGAVSDPVQTLVPRRPESAFERAADTCRGHDLGTLSLEFPWNSGPLYHDGRAHRGIHSSASSPFLSNRFSSLSDGPLGCLAPLSHCRTVDGLVFNTEARTV